MKYDSKINRHEDMQPSEGEHKYGNVAFADPTNKKYPMDTPEHVRAAWRYINHADNADKYDADEVRLMKDRIRAAAKELNVSIREE
jgi:hypothetical protein